MVELGGMLAAAILKVVSDQIASAIGGQIKLQKNFTKDLEKMKMALESVEALLQDAERRSIEEKPTRLWLRRLKVAMYAISDMLDEFEAETEAITQPSKHKFSLKKHLAVMVPYLTIGPKATLANKMKTMREDLEDITSQHKNFNLLAVANATELKVTDERETFSNMDKHIIGRTEERDIILDLLSESMTKEIMVLAIYGIGGLGKTTLAKMVYNNSQFKEYSLVWVYVSQTFDLRKIGNSIISQLSEKESQYTELQMIHNVLSRLFDDKKILIVLDDLWENNIFCLNKLKAMLEVGKGSRVVVIVTTRDESVAKEISSIQPHKLALLTNAMCWSIIEHKSDFNSRQDKEELKPIGKDIASKCGGVALAAQSLGYVMQSMTSRQWKLMRDSDIWSISDSKDPSFTHALASLRLSYSAMPPYLKLCFAYCAIFPKGRTIVKDELIQQWLALGLIEPTDVYSSCELGDIYIRQLLGLSFLQNSESPVTAGVQLEEAILFTMHDLVHDLARLVMVDEIVVPDKQVNTAGSCYRYALLDNCSKSLKSSNIRALRLVDCGEIELDGAAFSSAKSLRVLDLSECSIHKLPASIGILKQLRYLNAPKIQDSVIPDSITRLSKLTYLNLHGSSAISALPELIGDIEGLLYIDLSGCSGIKKLPESFGRLTKLEHLDLSNCSRVGDVSKFMGSLTKVQYLNFSHCPNIGELPADLGLLFELRYLNLSFSSYLLCCQEAEVLGTLTKLKYLNLSSEDCSLKKLPEALGSFSELKYLNLSGCKNLKELPTVIHNFRELRYLNLSRCLDSMLAGDREYHTDNLINSISALSNLEHLDLSHSDLVCWISASLCNLRKLHTLDLSRCPGLQRLPRNVSTMDSLKFLYLDSVLVQPPFNNNAIQLPHFAVYTRDGESGSNLVQLQHTDPVVLHITRLENVKTAEEAQSIKLIGKQRMNKLDLRWTRDAERFVDDKILLEKLMPPSTLKRLEIQGYMSDSFPAWLMDITHYLPNLVRMNICGLPKCHSLPPMEQLPNLNSLVLRDMASLEEWNTSYSSGEEHVIGRLEIHDCPKLKIKPLPPRANWLTISKSDIVLSSWGEYTGASTNSSYPVNTTLDVLHCEVPMHQWRLLQLLPGLTCLDITGCSDLSGSPEIVRHLSSLESLNLSHIDQQELPKWLGELTSLKELQISICRGLKELHKSMRLLTNLQSLTLHSCDSITSLPHWLGELNSLNKIGLWRCNAIRSLPEVIQQLTNLQELEIRNCSELKRWWESEDNQERACVLPTSLKKLEIEGCDEIRFLPEGIQQLTNLQELEIIHCSKLKWWCESEENKIKITSNQERACVLPTSLRKLKINGCRGISSLPEGIQQLTNLQELKIADCPALKNWCKLKENKTKFTHIKDMEIGDYFY